MKIELLDQAEADLKAGFEFYEHQQDGLGDYFLDSLFSDVESLQLYAGIHEKKFGYFRMLSKRFPYAIYYSFAGDLVRVYAILDCRQSPSFPEKRLT